MSRTVELSDEIAQMVSMVPSEELSPVFRQGALLRLPYLESRLREAEDRIKRFEMRYQTTIIRLKADGLPDDADHTMHEDFIEWEYWDDVLDRSKKAIEQFRRFLGKMEGSSLWGALSIGSAKSVKDMPTL
ncbi:MAG: hypothetical protein QME81_02325 [bacterium]|nr:hypothetical protein [bacterium]